MQEEMDWTVKYLQAGLSEVTSEHDALRQALRETTQPYYDQELAAGRYEVEGHHRPGEMYPLSEDDGELAARYFDPGGEVRRVVIPRDEFPELYEMRREIQWLMHRMSELEAKER
jgi:hypothetical protein